MPPPISPVPQGAHSLLTPEMMGKAKGYLSTCTDSIEFTDRGAVAFVEVNLPSIVGLAIYLDVDKSTVYSWSDSTSDQYNGEFALIVRQVHKAQEKVLLDKTLGGLYQTKVAGMLLSKHGYVEKTETDITTKGESINSPAIAELTQKLNDALKAKE